MKQLILMALVAFLALPGFAQRKAVSAAEQQKMISEIESSASSIKTLQCDFTQTKKLSLLNDKMVSKGKMYYSGGKALRWEYTSPYSYVFILNGSKVMMKNTKKTSVLDVKSSKFFQEITQIMMNSLTGKCLSNTSDFKVKMYVNGTDWIAVLTPQNKELKKMFKSITLHYSSTSNIVTEVDMKEKSGDTTEIKLSKVKKNAHIDSTLFSVG